MLCIELENLKKSREIKLDELSIEVLRSRKDRYEVPDK